MLHNAVQPFSHELVKRKRLAEGASVRWTLHVYLLNGINHVWSLVWTSLCSWYMAICEEHSSYFIKIIIRWNKGCPKINPISELKKIRTNSSKNSEVFISLLCLNIAIKRGTPYLTNVRHGFACRRLHFWWNFL